MSAQTDAAPSPEQQTTARVRSRTVSATVVTFGFGLLVIAVEPALAQSAGNAFCTTDMAETIKNMFTLIQFGGPLVGGVLALGATVAIPMVRRADRKQEIKELRTQAVIWGVIVASLGTEIVQFLLNNVVVGGASCGF